MSSLEQLLGEETVREGLLYGAAFSPYPGLIDLEDVMRRCMSGDFSNSLYSSSAFFMLHAYFLFFHTTCD